MEISLTAEQIDALLALLRASIFAARSPDASGNVVFSLFQMAGEKFFLLPEILTIVSKQRFK